MTPDELQLAAHQILKMVLRESPAEASGIAAVLFVEIMAIGLHGAGNEVAVGAIVQAINDRLAKIAAYHGSARQWKLIAVNSTDDQGARLG